MTDEEIFLQKLEEIMEKFDDVRESYMIFISRGDDNKDTLLEYRDRFTNLRSEANYLLSKTLALKVSRDDKACTHKKAILAVKLEGTIGSDKKRISLSKAETLAAGSEEYAKFLEERILYYESHNTIYGIYDNIQNFIHSIASRINKN